MKVVVFVAAMLLSVSVFANSIIFKKDTVLSAEAQEVIGQAVSQACPAVAKYNWTVREIETLDLQDKGWTVLRTSLYVHATDADGYESDDFYLKIEAVEYVDQKTPTEVISVVGGKRQCAR